MPLCEIFLCCGPEEDVQLSLWQGRATNTMVASPFSSMTSKLPVLHARVSFTKKDSIKTRVTRSSAVKINRGGKYFGYFFKTDLYSAIPLKRSR